jgi:CHAT domain-containing protein
MWPELASAIEEVNLVKAAFPGGADISIPGGDNVEDNDTSGVTASALLEKLPKATILHLACHGYQDPENPLKSGFVMSDEMLTIERLMQVPLPRAFMTFLSACETAKGDEVMPKQIIQLWCTDFMLYSRTSLIKLFTLRRLCFMQGSRA